MNSNPSPNTGSLPGDVVAKSKRGGRRAGAGRPKRQKSQSTLGSIDIESALAVPPPDEIDGVAQEDALSSVAALGKLLRFATSESAKITAAKEVLDRGYGKPAVEIGGDAAMGGLFAGLPLMSAPVIESISAQIRAEARKYALLAIEVLRRIRDSGASETARASASKALLDRGLGTVGKARMPDEQRERPLGKKEEAARAAEAAATGRFATPSPPRFRAPETVQ